MALCCCSTEEEGIGQKHFDDSAFMVIKQNILKRSRVLGTACVFCLLYCLIAWLPASAFNLLFCRVPAWLASLYLGATCEGTMLVLRSGRVLAVTPACGGSDFFILVCTMIAWYTIAPGGTGINGGVTRFTLPFSDQTVAPCEAGRANRLGEPLSSNNKAIFETIREACILLFMAWAFVNGVNSMRVVLSVWTRLLREALLPERFDAAVHMVSGVMIFFPALLCVWWLCKGKTCEVLHEQ